MRRLMRLPYFVRRLMAAWLRRKSRSDKSLKPEYIMDVNAEAVADAFRRQEMPEFVHEYEHAEHERKRRERRQCAKHQ